MASMLISHPVAGSLYLSNINGGAITEAEAREIMANYGPIELLWFASQTEREMFGLPEGIFVRFAFFDDCRDCLMVSNLEMPHSFLLSKLSGLSRFCHTPP